MLEATLSDKRSRVIFTIPKRVTAFFLLTKSLGFPETVFFLLTKSAGFGNLGGSNSHPYPVGSKAFQLPGRPFPRSDFWYTPKGFFFGVWHG